MTTKWYISPHRVTYLMMSFRYRRSPQKIQLIAHGLHELDNTKNGSIIKELKRRKIIK